MKTQKFIRLALLAGAVMAAISCANNDNDEPGTGIQPPTSAEFKLIRENALNDIMQIKMYKAEEGIDFTSIQGVHLTINPNSMYLNGNLVTGDVKLEFVELYKRGNMLVVNKPLMGTSEDESAKGPLITGGQFYINVTKDGQTIDAYYYMDVPTENTGDFNPEMSFWTGEENENEDMEWNQVGPNRETGGIFGKDSNYSIWGCFFGWINIDILYSLPDPKTQIWVKVPDGYDSKNCSVYVVYKDKPGALAYMDVWDSEKKMFTEHYGLAPIGFNFYVVFVSVQKDGQFIYAIKDVVIEENKIITFDASELKILDIDSLVKLINDLK